MHTDGSVWSHDTIRGGARVRRREPDLFPARVVRLRGEYDAGNAHALWEELANAIAIDDGDLICNLRDVTFLDASTITAFIRAKTALNQEGRRFSLCSLSTPAVRLVEICGLGWLVKGMNDTSPES